MEYRVMPYFRNFRDNIMDREELDLLRFQVLGLAYAKDRSGFFDKILKGEKRVLVVNYYLSFKLDALFVLTAHITRAGEPREKEKEAIQKYLAEIKSLEGE
jgi:hypothetical protein